MSDVSLKNKYKESRSPIPEGGFCVLCPRKCGARRDDAAADGFCASPSTFRIARAAAHYGEEPCISGTRGSGAIFFTGCNLRCVFCQNHTISRGNAGKAVDVQGFRDICRRLEDQGVHNINLVTPTHYSRLIAEALSGLTLSVPVLWNSSGYESVKQLRDLEGLVQIYMPDYKYADPVLARAFSAAGDYPQVAFAALKEMFRQTGPFVMGDDGLLKKGLMIRHLILPGHAENTLRVMDTVEDNFPAGSVLFSLLAQYTPLEALKDSPAFAAYPELKRTVSEAEYQRVMDYLDFSSLEDGYVQELSSAGEEAIPAFDGSGVE